jgi:TP901 family phage tail tape measure protein
MVQRNLKNIGTSAGSSASAVQLLRSTLATLGIGAALTNTVRTIASFEQAMSTVRAVSGSTAQEFAQLRDRARELGASTRYTATEAANSLVDLTRAGFTASESLGAVYDTLLLAQAGALGMSQSAEIMVNVMRGFRLGTDQAARVADVLAMTANKATTDVTQMADAMRYVGPVAAGTKVSLEETAAACGILSNAGLQASMAGTGLRRVISELESPSKKTMMILRQLGVGADSVRISQVGLTKALRNLKDAGVDTGMALEIFGDRGGPAFEVLSSSIPDLVKLNKELNNASGTSRRVAEIMDDNLNGAILKVRSAWQALQLSLGASDGGALTSSMIGLANALRYLADHIEIVQGALLGLAITSLPRAISMAIRLLSVLGGSGILIGAAIGALVAYRNEIFLSSARMATLGDFSQAAWERIKLSAETAFDALREKFSGFNITLDGVNFSIEGFVLLTARALDAWIGLWRGAILAVVGLLKNLGPVMKEIAINIVNDLISIADFGLRKFYEMLGKLPGRVGEPYRRLVEEGVIPRLQQTATGSMERLGQAVVDGFTKGFNEITVFEDSVNQMFNRADEIARERLAKMAQSTPEQGLSGGQGAAPTPGIETDPAQKLSQMQIGVQGGLEKLGTTINQWSTQVEATMVNAFSGAEDALVEFVQTGKFNFKSLVDSMLADLTRLLFRQMLAKTVGSLLPTGGAGAGVPSGGGKAGGGPVEPGSYYVVGERGREIFAPSVPGQIIPTDRISQAAPAQQGPAPQVNIINVESMEQALAAMRSSEGQRIIFNSRGQER